MAIRILEDGMLEYVGIDGEGLNQIVEAGNIKLVNALGEAELFAVQLAVKRCPFPLGGGETLYRNFLELVKTHVHLMPKGDGVGVHREQVVKLAGGGVNAPWDSYLQIAYDIATHAEYIHKY